VDDPGSLDQRPEHHCSGARVVKRRMGRRHVEGELLHQPCQARRLPLWQVEDEPRQRGGVDDRMLQRAFKPPPHQPGVKGVVAVLHQNRAVREPKKRPAGVTELWSSYQHRAVDVVPLFGVGIDRSPAVDEGVEEGEGSLQRESLSAKLQDQERRVASRLDVDGDELGIVKERLRAHLGCVDGDLFPLHSLSSAARFQEDRLLVHRDCANARRAKRISSALIALRSKTATA
jgi:hypothetical protein